MILGYGQIGSAVAREMAAHGWKLKVARRSAGRPALAPAALEFVQLERDAPDALARVLGQGVDAVVDTVAYTAEHGRQWCSLAQDIGSLTVISSISVYCDEQGRSMDQAQGRGFPAFPAAITEDQPCIAPGDDGYPARKAALEQVLLEEATCPVSILRPGAIHGEQSRQPREWWFIKRILDGRRRVPLAYAGAVRFHTSAAANVAALCRLTSERPGTRTLNIVDPVALSVREIGACVAAVYGADLAIFPLAGAPVGTVGQSPWCIPSDMVMAMGRAEALGYRPVAAYGDAIAAVCRSAEAMAQSGIALPAYLGPEFFNYAAEDAIMARPS